VEEWEKGKNSTLIPTQRVKLRSGRSAGRPSGGEGETLHHFAVLQEKLEKEGGNKELEKTSPGRFLQKGTKKR